MSLYEEAKRKADQDKANGATGYNVAAEANMTSQQIQAARTAWHDSQK